MKANYQKLTLDVLPDLYADFWVQSPMFGFHWHYHPEIEICYVKRGFGQRLVGESIERFEAGDFVIVGSNLPHCWITDDVFNQSDEVMEIFVIHIDTQKIKGLWEINDFKPIASFLNQAQAGFAFDILADGRLLDILKAFESAEGFAKTLHLLELLNQMQVSTHRKQLCTSTYKPETGKQVETRILNVCQYIHDHYKNKITVDTLAGIVNMNTAAFCRFFKKVIGKTALEYINELRINAACSELIVSQKPISEIAYQNGFSSLSHFNKLFQKYKKRTPSRYRAAFSDND